MTSRGACWNKGLTLSQPSKVLPAKFLVCFNFQSASMLREVEDNVAQVSNSLDLSETPSNSATHKSICIWNYSCVK